MFSKRKNRLEDFKTKYTFQVGSHSIKSIVQIRRCFLYKLLNKLVYTFKKIMYNKRKK